MSESSSFLDQRNEAFREVHSGPTKNDFSVKVDESVYREAMTLKDAQRKNEETVNELFDQASKENDIGSVFEKGEKLEEKAFTSDKKDIKSVTNNGIEPNAIDAIKRELSAQEKDIKGPSYEPSLNFVK